MRPIRMALRRIRFSKLVTADSQAMLRGTLRSLSYKRKRGADMETVLIALLVVFLLGGGGWGYSRWRRN
jgi:hypothetical protein